MRTTLLIVLLGLSVAWGNESRVWLPQHSDLGLGLRNEHIRQIQTDPGGDLNTFKLRPYLEASLSWKFASSWSFSPEFQLGLPHTGRDETLKRLHYALILPVSWRYQKIALRAGAGIHFLRLWGPGGTQRLDNGFGTDAFFLPSEARTAVNTVWIFGGEWYATPNWSLRTDVVITHLTDSKARTFGQTLSLHYHFDLNFDFLFPGDRT